MTRLAGRLKRLVRIAVPFALVILPLLTPHVAQAAPPGVTINRYFCQWHDEVSTTDTVWDDPEPSAGYYPLQLTFTPPSTATYLILVSLSVSNSSTSGTTYIHLLMNSTETNNPEFTPGEVGDYAAISWHLVPELTGSTEYTFKLQFKTSASYTAYMKNAHLLILPMSDYHHIDTAADNTNSETYVDRVTLTVPSGNAGDYLVLASAGMSIDSTLHSFYFQLTHNGTSQGEVCKEVSVAMEYRPYTIMRIISFDSGVQTLKIQYKTENSASPVYCKGVEITAIRLSELGIDDNRVDVDGPHTTTSTSYVDVTDASVTFSPSPSQYGDYLIMSLSLLSGDKTNQKAYIRTVIDDTPHGEMIFRPNDTKDEVPFFNIHKARFAPGSHTIKIQSKTENANMTVTSKNSRILAFKANTLQSYSDSGVTECTTFTSGNHTVNIYGYAYQYDYEAETPAAMPYKVAYYDGGSAHDGVDGAQVVVDAINSNYNRSLSSTCNCSLYPSSSYGTWHAVGYRADTGDAAPASTYTANDSNSTLEVEFTVEASAIPEFPTVIAAIGVAGLCFGIYYRMRRRLGRVVRIQ